MPASDWWFTNNLVIKKKPLQNSNSKALVKSTTQKEGERTTTRETRMRIG